MAPLVAVTASLTSSGAAILNRSYIAAIQAAGGAPVLVPPQSTPSSLHALLGTVSALVLTGGGDIDPARYGEEAHPTVAGVSQERDEVEFEATRLALAQGMPLLAICRGMQVLNVALGGSLYQDIPSELATTINHAQTSGESPRERHEVTHPVRLEEGSGLARLLGATELEVNSMHHQAVKRAGEGLREVGWAPDGVVEAVELAADDGRWVYGVQWHPEELVDSHDHARRLFAAVIAEASSHR